ncbi:hypothetical protein GCM10010307_72520 [Streptomyces vastus]|uniref:Uncharacterized protein n=1 Tax=Streptomyces vastus TaxID=285451 RepID=A0ABN3RPI6_9ACTN
MLMLLCRTHRRAAIGVHSFRLIECQTARTLPWQLDPSRRSWGTVTEIELAEPDGLVRITSYEDTARGSRSSLGAAVRRFRDPRPSSGRCPGKKSSARRSNDSYWMRKFVAGRDCLTAYHLPSCAPDPNAVERVWFLLRRG